MFVFFSWHISLFLRTMWATAFFLGVLSLFKLFEKALRAVTLFSKPICAILLTLREPCYLVWNIKTLESVLGPPHTHTQYSQRKWRISPFSIFTKCPTIAKASHKLSSKPKILTSPPLFTLGPKVLPTTGA